jgi:hypothetical protein
MFQQRCVLLESPRGSRKYPNCYSNSLTNRLFCSVLLPIFTVVGMDRCEKNEIAFCGLYRHAEKKKKKRKYWIHKVFRAREEEGEFHTLFGRLKNERQKFFKYFRMSFSKFENLKQLLHTDIEKKNTKFLRHLPPLK